MRKRADKIIGVILEVYRIAATRNGLLAKPVDRGLDTNIGYGKHNALQPRWNTDSEYPFQVFESEFGLLAPHAKHVVFHNKHDNEHGANDVGNYGSERNTRDAHVARNTSETKIDLYLNLDGGAPSKIDTGLKFYDHMLDQIPHHGGVTLNITCRGDLEVDEHHTMEDVAIALGEAIYQALGSKRGIERYGFVLPMDESRAMVLIDFGGRSELVWDVDFTREYVGDTPTEMYAHVFKSLASAMHANLYVSARGENNHHIIEGVFKAFARALRQAVSRNPFSYDLPSSKGVL